MARQGIALVGPTAVGKTALALRIVERLDAEIISMDSRQVYRGMDIGTAKATAAERAAVPHHGLDLVDPDERYSAGRFARDARRWIRDIRARGLVPLLVGGTGFFLHALTDPLFDEPPMDDERRARLQVELERLGTAKLREWLRALDPESARRLAGGGGRQRLLRALEVALLTGRPLPWWQRARPGAEALDLLVLVLDLPRARLYERIGARVDRMLDAGLLAEVATLLERGYHPDAPAMSATGYAEIAAHLRGDLELDEAVDRIRRRTRQYARRQLTWFRNKLPDDSIWLDGTRDADQLAEEAVERWRRVS